MGHRVSMVSNVHWLDIYSEALIRESVPQTSISSTRSARRIDVDEEPVAVHTPLATADAGATSKTKPRVAGKKVGRRADKMFAAAKTTNKGSQKKATGKGMKIGPTSFKWINTGTDKTTTPETVVTYLTTLAAHRATSDPEYLLGTVQALLREGERLLAFTDNSIVSIVERCQCATFVSSAADFLCMAQYLQLVFKVSG